ncbi:flagellin [Halobiforma lacisalsi AJ5]|uniref:Flagellin n=1 Tax=Natronobacterium lacisalsi AJ5 TaxID=358396 RepID=A0A1P8LW47_NATLA|nr:type IV pilin N-terminal domain-containing protein [Halobiforma lacisalsi]APX00025.1 flagellin [Halobiforma lacisalsi AJ5]
MCERGRWEDRGISPLLGTVLLVGITICLVAVIAVGFVTGPVDAPTMAAFELTIDGGGSEITIEHATGDAIDVRELSLTVAVDGEELSEQPPVPFVGAVGFDGAPTGPFNAEASPHWRPGERASFRVAETNDPTIEVGDTVNVGLVVDGQLLAELEATA